MWPVSNNVINLTVNPTVYGKHDLVIQTLPTSVHVPDWLLGAIGGAVFTQLLTIMWDVVRRRLETRKREKIFMFVMLQDITKNKESIASTRYVIQQELTFVDNNQSVVPPIEMIYSGIHDFLKLDIPKSLLTPQVLSLARDVSRKVLHINETIRSRERWRIHNQNFDNFSRRLKMYDGYLLELLNQLDKNFDELTELMTVKVKLSITSIVIKPSAETQD